MPRAKNTSPSPASQARVAKRAAAARADADAARTRAALAEGSLDASLKLANEENGKLKSQIDELNKKLENAKAMWVEEAQKNGQAIQANMENDRLMHRQELIELIAAGKNLEAINYLMTTKTMVFKIDVRFADDKTAEMARQEMFEKVKKTVLEDINKLKLMPVKAPYTAEQAA